MSQLDPSPISVVASVAPFIYLAGVKDREYVRILYDSLLEVLQLDFPFGIGGRNAMRLSNEIETLARLVYYYSMYCLGNRTLGQEYVQNIPVVMTSSGSPTPINDSKRLWLVAGQVIFPYVIQQQSRHGLGGVSRFISNSSNNSSGYRGTLKTYLLKLMRWLTSPSLLDWLSRAHLALFFLNSRYTEVWLRICRVRFVRNSKDRQPNSTYTVLGLLLSLELVGVAVQEVSRWWREDRIKKTEPEVLLSPEVDDSNAQGDSTLTGGVSKCALCMCPRKHTSATECGHLFCWECIIKWCRASKKGCAECPLCRQPVQPQKVLMLQY